MKQKLLAPRIVIDPAVRFGKPIIEGTRITVEEVLGWLASGMNYSELETEYQISKEDIQAVITYAASFMKGEEVRSAPASKE